MTAAQDQSPTPTRRGSGVLLHPTSLPGRRGIGDLGEAAHGFLDWLAEAGQSVWQILPLNATGGGLSPYAAASSFAGNTRLLSLERLAEELGLAATELPAPPASDDGGAPIRLPAAAAAKDATLAWIWKRIESGAGDLPREELLAFAAAEENLPWLADWALFAALKEEHAARAWWEWPEALRRRQPTALDAARQRLRGRVDFHVFAQHAFFRQWSRLKREARDRGIRLLGDVPIYVALDSCDVWADQDLFDLDDDGRPHAVAGVPPDYFTETGQLWGNPLYRWDRLAERDFDWWIRRLSFLLRQVDLLRLDHFRAFRAYWRVPADAPDARSGRWVDAPGEALFDAVAERIGSGCLVAEDLGVITDDVTALRRRFGFPGMKVLQFAFDEEDSPHLPHNHTSDTIAYTATHDNDTTRGWFEKAGEETRARAREYLGVGADGIGAAMVRAALTSVADLAVVPAQDLLGLGSEARMNVPGEPEGHWGWRLGAGDLDGPTAERLRRLTRLAGRHARHRRDRHDPADEGDEPDRD